jgi:gliding motility-associated-like protein
VRVELRLGLTLLLLSFALGSQAQEQQYLGFLENKGQLIDQHEKPAKDVLYLLPGPQANLQLRKNGFSYDRYTVETIPLPQSEEAALPAQHNLPQDSSVYHYHRVDVEWLGTNRNITVTTSGQSTDYRNYYTTGTPKSGVTHVHHYQRVVYHNVWPNIDVEFLATQQGLKYNYIIHPGGNINAIQWRYIGADKHALEAGKILLETTHGSFSEHIPLSYTQDLKDTLAITYKNEKQIYGFVGNLPANQTAIIDPVPTLLWSTFWGFNIRNKLDAIETTNQHLILAGSTTNPNALVTTGAHQTTIGGNEDGLISLMTKSRVVQWTTFLGGSNQDQTHQIQFYDGHLYLLGTSLSTNLPATTGKFQTVNNGGRDGFVSKFKMNGTLKWLSYSGGNLIDWPSYFKVINGNIYIAGDTYSSNNIATTGAYSSAKGNFTAFFNVEGFICKFDTAFVTKIWGTYLGGNNASNIGGMYLDANECIYIAGFTAATNFATPGAYLSSVVPQNLGRRNYFGRFSPTGALQWRSYIDGEGWHYPDLNGHNGLIILSLVNFVSNVSIPCNAGNWSSSRQHLLYSIDSLGWPSLYANLPAATYDYLTHISVRDSSIFVSGNTSFNYTGLAGAFQNTLSGPNDDDAFIARLTYGNVVWLTYVGGIGSETISNFELDHDSIFYSVSTLANNFPITDSVLGSPIPNLKNALMLFRDTCNSLILANYGTMNGLSQVCPYDTVNYSINPQLFTEYYKWSVPPGAQIVSGQGTACMRVVFAATSGNITVIPRNACDTATTISLAVTVAQPPAVPNISPVADTLFLCPGDSIQLSADITTNLLWSTGDTLPNLTIFTAGAYSLGHLDTTYCQRHTTDSLWVVWSPTTDTPAVAPNGLLRICMGDSVQLSATTAARYLWSTGDTTQSIWVNQPGLYNLQTKNGSLCWSFPATAVQVLVDSPAAQPALNPATPISICQGDSALLSSPGNNAPLWSTGSNAASIFVSATGIYAVAVADTGIACTPTWSDSVSVTVVPLAQPPVISATGSPTLCQGDSVLLSTNQPQKNLWSTGDTAQNIWVSQAGTYYAFAQNALQCNSDTSNLIMVTVQTPFAAPSLSASGATTICQGDSVYLSANTTLPVLWSTGDTTAGIWAKNAGSYFLLINQTSACPTTYSDTLSITVLPAPATPAINATGNSALCNGNPITLSSNLPAHNRWSTGDTTQSITIATTGTVKLWQQLPNGCSSDTAYFTVQAGGVNLGNDLTLCAGERVQLTAQSSNAVVWNTGATGNSIWVSPTATTSYWATDPTTGCSDTINITVYPRPTAQFSAAPTQGGVPLTVQLINTSTGATAYTWLFGDGTTGSATNTTHTYQNYGSYTIQLIAINAQGCADTAAGITITALAADNFWIPNSFTPHNQDGTNDLFIMHGIPQPYSFSVFDRWGNRVFHSDDYQNNWDGMYNGQPLPLGAYTHQIEYRYINPNATVADPKGAPRSIQGVVVVQ